MGKFIGFLVHDIILKKNIIRECILPPERITWPVYGMGCNEPWCSLEDGTEVSIFTPPPALLSHIQTNNLPVDWPRNKLLLYLLAENTHSYNLFQLKLIHVYNLWGYWMCSYFFLCHIMNEKFCFFWQKGASSICVCTFLMPFCQRTNNANWYLRGWAEKFIGWLWCSGRIWPNVVYFST